MSAPFLIRCASNSDCEAAVEIIRSVYDEFSFTWDPDEYHADLYDLESYYLRKGHHFWIAEANGQPVGTVALDIFPEVAGTPGSVVMVEGARRIAGCDCALQRLYVRADGRKAGVGAALMKTVLDTARILGRGRLEIWSDKRFTDAHRLYFRFGAVQVGDRVCHDPDQSPEWGLYIALTPPGGSTF